jgi:soluble lytic murein transglycosylase-like protein
MKKKAVLLLFLFLIQPYQSVKAYDDPVAGIDANYEKFVEIDSRAKIYDVPITSDIQLYTLAVCGNNEVEMQLALAIMWKESNFITNAQGTNSNGTKDKGLMQINSCNYKTLKNDLGVTDLLDAKQNILSGVYMLSKLNKQYGDIHKVLTAYNIGGKRMNELFSQGYNSTAYSRDILKYYYQLTGLNRKQRRGSGEENQNNEHFIRRCQ